MKTVRRGGVLGTVMTVLVVMGSVSSAVAAGPPDRGGPYVHLGGHGGGLASALTDDFGGTWSAGGTAAVVWWLGPDLALGVRQALHVAVVPYGDFHGEPRFGDRGYGDGPLEEVVTFFPVTSLLLVREWTDTTALNLTFGIGFVASSRMELRSLVPRLPTFGIELDVQLLRGGAGDLRVRVASELIFAAVIDDAAFDAILWFPSVGLVWRVGDG